MTEVEPDVFAYGSTIVATFQLAKHQPRSREDLVVTVTIAADALRSK
jgi:hypothetical protein